MGQNTGEEYPHTNTQLFGIHSEQNRFKPGAEISAPSIVAGYISTLTAELGRQPT